MPSQALVWWHLSDLHWDEHSSTERRAFLSVLYDDLRARVEEFGPPDFVVVSGDIALSGEERQYIDAEREFFAPLRNITGSPPCPFFFVPGNHDLRRPVARTVNPELILSLNSKRSLNDFLDIQDYIDMVRRPFASFEAFLARAQPGLGSPGLGWSTRIRVRDATILLVGLNSSWASSYHRKSDNTVEDERHLLIGQLQLLPLTEPSGQQDLSIVVLHHPLKWLNGFCDTQCRQLLQRHADFVLFGHTHALHDLSQTLSAAGSTVFLPAPAIYDRAPTDTVEYARGYNVVRFDLATRRGAAHYYKYSDAYATKFDSFVELYSTRSQSYFPIDLSHRDNDETISPRPQYRSFSEAVATFPDLANLHRLLELALETHSHERHTVEYFESLVVDLVRDSDLVDQELSHIFWECAVLSRALLFCDLEQLNSPGPRPYVYRQSVDLLCARLSEIAKQPGVALQLTLDAYRRLNSMALDSCSFSGATMSVIPENYRRLFAVPWALSRLLIYLDYPELIPLALQSEGRIANLFTSDKPERFAIMGYRFDQKRSIISVDLRVQDKNGFLAVTLLKHYFDIAVRQAADFWRQSQRVMPPFTLLLEFPRWQNKRVDAYELTVETTPIVRLLMGRAMYHDARHVWFRELLQNALDASSARKALDGPEYSSRLEVTLHGPTRCTIRDNGIGMSRQHILLYLTRLGRSIWNSEELTEGKPLSREGTLRAIGKFGIGFAAVFQDADRVSVRTRFFREVGESGWIVEFTSVEKPFLLEAADTPMGTEVEVQLRTEKDAALPPSNFLNLVKDFFLYIDENISISPDPGVPRNLSDVSLVDIDARSRMIVRDTIAMEHLGPYSFRLRCMFCFDFNPKGKDDRLPSSYLLIANSGVKVFQQSSLLLKPGKRYVLMDESERGPRQEEDPREHGISNFWVVIDFEKGSSPILPSRLEIDVDAELSRGVLAMIHRKFCEALGSVTEELASQISDSRQRRKALLGALMHSTQNHYRHHRRNDGHGTFCNVAGIQSVAVSAYKTCCDICLQSIEGTERYVRVRDLKAEPPGVFVIEHVTKSPLFRVYAKATGLKEWVTVENHREYILFEKAIESVEWKGFAFEKDLYAERMRVFAEVEDSPLVSLVRGDYAIIGDQIFGKEAFIVLPSNIPKSWKRGEAADYTRKAVMGTCPPRVLINPSHEFYKHVTAFATAASSQGAPAKLRELKLILDNLCDGVIENDRIGVARERWKTLQRDLRGLLEGKLPEMGYDALVQRRH